jgi:hypothetical protein
MTCRSIGASNHGLLGSRFRRRVVYQVPQQAYPLATRTRSARRIGFSSKLAGGREIIRDVEHAVLADRHHRRAGKIGTPDPPHQGGSSEIVRLNICGVCHDRHHGFPHGGYDQVSIVHRGERLDGSTHLQDVIVLGVAVRMLESPLIAAQHAE